jgi:branched-chain amino acid transport system ATP-binding protein
MDRCSRSPERGAVAEILRLEGLCKRYGSLVVTDQLGFDLAEGEALGVIGPNGAGKSTMFGLIAGGVRPDAGHVHFAGRDITALPPHARCRAGIARSYQIPHPFAKMTVFENTVVGAAFAGRRHGASAERHCVDVLHLTGLLPRANTLAGDLPLLARKRLELARALATEPRVLLLDEIGGGLTEHECHELIETIRAVHRTGVSIIWIEHIVHALISVVSRLLVLNFGRKLAEGEPRAVLTEPAVQEVYMGLPAE